MWQRQEVQEVLPSLRATPAVPAGLTRRRAARNPGTIDHPSDLFRLATLTLLSHRPPEAVREAALVQVLERLLVWSVIGLASRGSWPLSRCWWSPPSGSSHGEEGGSECCCENPLWAMVAAC